MRSVIDEPVREVVAHVVAAERQHRERVTAQLAEAAERGGGLLGAHGRGDEHAVLPVARLEHQRHGGGAAAAEQERRDRDAFTSSHSGAITGHCDAGTQNREFGCAAGSSAGVQSSRFQSMACAGGSPSMPSHHTSPSSLSAVLVKTVLRATVCIAFGLLALFVPGATPKNPNSGLIA